MKTCEVFGCCSNDKKDKIQRRFFKFPRDNERSVLWQKFTWGKQNTFDCKNISICDRHFVETDFFFDKLKKNAVPTRNAPNPKKVKPTEENKKSCVNRMKDVGSFKSALEIGKACDKSKAKSTLSRKSSPKLKLLNPSSVLNTLCTSGLKIYSKDKIINKTYVDVGYEDNKHTRDHDYITSRADSNNSSDIVLTPVTDPPDFIKKKVAELMKSHLVSPQIKLSSSVMNKIAHSDKELENGKPSLNISSSSNGIKEITLDLSASSPSKSSDELTEPKNSSSVNFNKAITTVINSSEERVFVRNIEEEDEVSQKKIDPSNKYSTKANVSQPQTKKFKSSNLQDESHDLKNLLKDLILFPASPKKKENTALSLNDTILTSNDSESDNPKSVNDAFETNSNDYNCMNSTKKSSNYLIKNENININTPNLPLKVLMNKVSIKPKKSGIYRNNPNSLLKTKTSPSNLINDKIETQIKRKNIIVQPHLNKGRIEQKSSGVYKNHPNSLHKNKSCSSNFVNDKIASEDRVDVMQEHLNEHEIEQTSSGEFRINPNLLLNKNKSCSSNCINDEISSPDKMDVMEAHLNKEVIDNTSTGEFRNNSISILKNESSSSNFISDIIASEDKVDFMQAHLNKEEIEKIPSKEFKNNHDSLLKNKSDKSISIIIDNEITAQNKRKVVKVLLNKSQIEKTSSGVFRSNSLLNDKSILCPLEFEEAQVVSLNSNSNFQKNVQSYSSLPIDGMKSASFDSNVPKNVQNYSSSPTDGMVESTILTDDSYNKPSTSQGNLTPKSFVMQEHLKRVQYLSRKKGIVRKYTKNTFNSRKRLLQLSKYSIAAKAESVKALYPHEKPIDLEKKGEWSKLYLPSLVSKSFPRLNEAYINNMVNVLRASLPKLQPRDKLEVSFLLSVMSAYPGAPEYVKELLTQRLNMLYIATLFQWDTAIALAMEGCDKSGPTSNLTVPSIPLNKGVSRIIGKKNKYPRKNPEYFDSLWYNEKIKVPDEAKKPRIFAYEKIIVKRTADEQHDSTEVHE